MERREKRSEDPREALQYLVETLADRSEVSSVVLVSEQGSIVAGMGSADEVAGLSKIAGPVTRGERCDRFDEVTRGTDFLGRRIAWPGGTLYLAALGHKLRRVHEAVAAVCRIVRTDQA